MQWLENPPSVCHPFLGAFLGVFPTVPYSLESVDFQRFMLEAEVGIEPTHDGFANRKKCLNPSIFKGILPKNGLTRGLGGGKIRA